MVVLKNKRAQEGGAVPVIMIIILAVLVLIFAIWWFTSSGSTLADKIANLGGGKINVDTVKQACQSACDTNQAYQYNNVLRSVVFVEKAKAIALTCKQLENSGEAQCLNGTNGVITEITDKTNCTNLAWRKADSTTNAPPGCSIDGKTFIPTIQEAGCKGTWREAWPAIVSPCDKF